jgi:hypothetical protein
MPGLDGAAGLDGTAGLDDLVLATTRPFSKATRSAFTAARSRQCAASGPGDLALARL